MELAPVTLLVRGRPLVISAEELRAELDTTGPPRSLPHLEAICRCNDRLAAIARLRRLVQAGDPGVATMQAVLGLSRLGAAEAAEDLETLAARLGGSPGAIARAAALLVADRAGELARLVDGDRTLAHHSPQPYLHLLRVPTDAAQLFAAWVAALRRGASQLGVTAYRAFLGDVAEALFRSLQHGGAADRLLSPADRGFVVDSLCAELPGTTDFIAARGMAWLLGALEPSDETARAAIERARDRFRDAAFAADCEAMLSGLPWPPPPPR
jgi:hypothetical protein